jgi:endonuclease G
VTAGQEPGALGAGSDLEKMVEPFHDDDYTERQGYNERFLGTRVPLPRVLDLSVVSKLDDGSHAIPYEHFSIVMHKKRRIAVFAASNVDGRPEARRPDPTRRYTRGGLSGLGKNDQEKWFTDPRIAALHQLPDRFFNKDRASFDKGHLVRRDAVAWGEDYDEVRRANGDSYHVTNCSPQVKGFNRSNLGGLWGKLENLVLDQAEADGEVYSVFAGPVLDDGDPAFSGFDDNGRVRVSIPRRFWKVVVARRGAQLESFGFLLDQDLTGVDFEFAVNAEWRARLISIPDLEAEIGLVRFPRKIHDSDQADAEDGERVRAAAGMERFHAEEEPCRDPEPTPTH